MLLDAGANANATDSINMTPLMLASNYAHAACVRLLLGRVPRLDVATQDSQGSMQDALLMSVREMIKAHNGVRGNGFGEEEEEDPSLCMVLLLKSRRITAEVLARDIAILKSMPSQARRLPPIKRMLKVLGAQAKGERRWCHDCHKLTPDHDLDTCASCHEVAYCGRDCQRRDWKEHGHKVRVGIHARESAE